MTNEQYIVALKKANQAIERQAIIINNLKSDMEINTYNNIATALLDLMEKADIENFVVKVFSTDDKLGRDLQITCEYLDGKSVVDELTELRDEITSLHSYSARVVSFVSRAVEKLRGIPEFRPTGDILNRVLRLTPKIALGERDLEMKADGIAELGCYIVNNGELIPEEEVQRMVNACLIKIQEESKL